MKERFGFMWLQEVRCWTLGKIVLFEFDSVFCFQIDLSEECDDVFVFCGFILRFFQHTPGTYPRPPTKSLWRDSFHLGVWGFMGYAPGVCWGSLRFMVASWCIMRIAGTSHSTHTLPVIISLFWIEFASQKNAQHVLLERLLKVRIAQLLGGVICNTDKTLPETNSSHLKIGHPKRKRSYSNFQPSIFRGELLVSGRVTVCVSGLWSKQDFECNSPDPLPGTNPPTPWMVQVRRLRENSQYSHAPNGTGLFTYKCL